MAYPAARRANRAADSMGRPRWTQRGQPRVAGDPKRRSCRASGGHLCQWAYRRRESRAAPCGHCGVDVGQHRHHARIGQQPLDRGLAQRAVRRLKEAQRLDLLHAVDQPDLGRWLR